MISKRDFIKGVLSSACIAVGIGEQSRYAIGKTAETSERKGSLTRIAFGSCAKQWESQEIWQTIQASDPELFLFLGDTIYKHPDDAQALGITAALERGYQLLGSRYEFNEFQKSAPIHAIWDDNDFATSDSGGDFADKEESKRLFLNFWSVDKSDPRWSQKDGLYASHTYGPEGRRIQIVLLDTRFNRSPLNKIDDQVIIGNLAGSSFGPYLPNPEGEDLLLGEEQWQWLESELQKPAEIRLICSTILY